MASPRKKALPWAGVAQVKTCIVGRTGRKESAQYMKHMQSEVALQKSSMTLQSLLQAMFNTMGAAQTEQTLQIM